MKSQIYLCAAGVAAMLGCACAVVARHFAGRAYGLWLDQAVGNELLFRSASRLNHIWLVAMLGFVLVSLALIVAGVRARRRVQRVLRK